MSAPSQQPSPLKRPGDETVKETFESVVIAFVLAFVFRAYVVEAFVIPTGSMAPTLMGEHLRVTCSECGYTFAADVDPEEVGRGVAGRRSRRHDHWLSGPQPENRHAVCPMCHYPNTITPDTRLSAGDRILVHKFIYHFSEPRRWDVVVFKAPHVPHMNFIKRLVGLSQEQLWIVEGNIYVKPLGTPGEPWHIARKTHRPKVQRAVWQPIYHSQYTPLDGGSQSPVREAHPWRVPWVPDENTGDDWDLNRGYRHRSAAAGTLRFDFDTAQNGGPGLYPYNHLKQPFGYTEPIEDVRIAACFVAEGPGFSMKMRTMARLDDPDGRGLWLTGGIEANGTAVLVVTDPFTSKSKQLAQSGQVGPFEPARPRTVELWYVDQEASLWVDGRRVLAHPFNPPMQTVLRRPLAQPTPQVSIHVAGSPVTMYRVELDRDLYYSSINLNGTPARGGLIKTKTHQKGDPIQLNTDNFFCLGDNSPMSSDGRYWSGINQWVKRRMFPPMPDPRNDDKYLGIVPRKLMMGRAFFVYFPAALSVKPTSRGITPNFGDMRFIH